MKNETSFKMPLIVLTVIGLVVFGSPIAAQGFGGGNGFGGPGFFIDEDGDGFNDNAPDADGDGIPNGIDDDFVPPMDGTGNGFGGGDGVCDSTGTGGHNGGGWGPGNGGGNGGVGPGDGTGNGPGDCTGDTDGIMSRREYMIRNQRPF
ncbi:MAG: hypothetical protein H8E70_01860 [Candidatus Marinimicrobia bacterium]|nr:hypothetical protein [Candidatus Neomarinimicrobiota bacterium]